MSDFIPVCPYCNSTNVKCTVAGYAEKATGYAVSFIPAVFAGGVAKKFFNNPMVSTYITDAIVGGTPTQYKCKRCGKTFHTSKYVKYS